MSFAFTDDKPKKRGANQLPRTQEATTPLACALRDDYLLRLSKAAARKQRQKRRALGLGAPIAPWRQREVPGPKKSKTGKPPKATE